METRLSACKDQVTEIENKLQPVQVRNFLFSFTKSKINFYVSL